MERTDHSFKSNDTGTAWTMPLPGAMVSVDDRLRLRLFQLFTATVVIVPVVAESTLWVVAGKPADTAPLGGLLVLTNALNYGAFLRHRKLPCAAAVGLSLSGANFLATSTFTGGLLSPALFGSTLVIALAAFIVGSRAAYGMSGLVIAGLLAVSASSEGSHPQVLVFHILVAVGLGLLLGKLEGARTEMRMRHDELLNLVAQSTDLIGVRRGMRVVYHNPAFVELTGKDPAQAEFDVTDFHPPWALERVVQQGIPHAIEHGSWTGETAVLDRDGKEVPVLQTLNVHATRDGQISDGTTIMKDISALKETENSLRHANAAAETALAAKSQFLANMSHEIRTPLNGVLGMALLLRDDIVSAAGQERLDLLERCGHHLLTIIDDILDLSKMEAGKLRLAPAPFSPGAVAGEVRDMLEPIAEERGNRVLLELPQEQHTVVGDAARYRQVLYNLVGNAIKFTQQGEVRIRVEQHGEGGHLQIATSVEDTGVGICAERIAAILEPFEQADNTTERRYGGTGLGLAICERLLALMGGQLEIDSQPGRGSTFTFHLDLPRASQSSRAPAAPESAASRRVAPAASATCLRVIVAEDNRVNQKVITGILARMQVDAAVVDNGKALLEALRAAPYDLVLMDCHMPEMDGFEATETIRRELPHQPRIVALTASAMPEERQRCLTCGMDGFLSKPVSPADLANELSRTPRCDASQQAASE